MVDGFPQDPIDGVSLAYTFNDPKAPSRKKVQYFDNNGSRAIYQDGWIAATFGPLVPWLPGAPGLATWDSAKDKWELYQITKDFSEADDLAGKPSRNVWRICKRCSTSRRRPTRSIRSAPASGFACIPKIASSRPIRAGGSTRRRRGCLSFRRRVSVAKTAP